MRHSMGYSMGHSIPHGMRNGVRKGILNSMRCAPPVAAPKTSDESPPWHAQSWYTPRHAPWYATYHNICTYTPRICLRNAPARTFVKTYYSGPGKSLALIIVAKSRYR